MRCVIVMLVALALMSCSAEWTARPPVASPAQPTPTASAIARMGGCGSTAVVHGAIPQGLDDAGGHNNPIGVPYAVAHPPLAAGFLFGDPLRAGHPENPASKILWVVRTPRNGALTIDGHPLGAPTPAIHQVQPDNSSPGEIYPSIVDAPLAGCWQFDLRWASSHTQVELAYIAG